MRLWQSCCMSIGLCLMPLWGWATKAPITAPLNTPSGWHTSAGAYLWAISMNGSETINGQRMDVHDSFADILKKLQSAGMLWLSVGNGRFNLYFNGIRTNLASEHQTSVGVTQKTHNTFAIYAGGISWNAIDVIRQQHAGQVTRQLIVQPYAGVRYTSNASTLDVGPLVFAQSANWTQPLLGTRLIYRFRQNARLSLAGDLGYAGSDNQSFNAVVMLGFRNLFGCEALGLHLGYRYLHQYYQNHHGAFKWNMDLSGPILGLSLRFA